MIISPRSSISSKGHQISQNSISDEGGSNSEKYLKLEDFNSFSNEIENTLGDITKILNQLVVE